MVQRNLRKLQEVQRPTHCIRTMLCLHCWCRITTRLALAERLGLGNPQKQGEPMTKSFPKINLMEADTCTNGHDVRDKSSSLTRAGRGWSCRKCMALHQTRRRQAKLKPTDEIPYLKMEIKRLLPLNNHKETLEKILELLDHPAWMPS